MTHLSTPWLPSLGCLQTQWACRFAFGNMATSELGSRAEGLSNHLTCPQTVNTQGRFCQMLNILCFLPIHCHEAALSYRLVQAGALTRWGQCALCLLQRSTLAWLAALQHRNPLPGACSLQAWASTTAALGVVQQFGQGLLIRPRIYKIINLEEEGK